jgi:hypothetical protein
MFLDQFGLETQSIVYNTFLPIPYFTPLLVFYITQRFKQRFKCDSTVSSSGTSVYQSARTFEQ